MRRTPKASSVALAPGVEVRLTSGPSRASMARRDRVPCRGCSRTPVTTEVGAWRLLGGARQIAPGIGSVEGVPGSITLPPGSWRPPALLGSQPHPFPGAGIVVHRQGRAEYYGMWPCLNGCDNADRPCRQSEPEPEPQRGHGAGERCIRRGRDGADSGGCRVIAYNLSVRTAHMF